MTAVSWRMRLFPVETQVSDGFLFRTDVNKYFSNLLTCVYTESRIFIRREVLSSEFYRPAKSVGLNNTFSIRNIW